MKFSKKTMINIRTFLVEEVRAVFFPKKNPVNTRAFILHQFFFLLPLLLMLIAVSVYCGSDEPASVFAQSRAENGIIYKVISAISSANIIGYILYGAYFIFAFIKRDPLIKWFVIFYLLMQVMFGAVAQFLKVAVGRPRPYMGESELMFFNFSRDYHSFPSGHTFEICGALGPFAQKSVSLFVAFLWGLIPAALGFSRIYLAMHHRLDVFAAAILGSFTTYAIVYLTLLKREQLKQPTKRRKFFSVENC